MRLREQVLFHPLSPHLLFVASRHSTHLDVWDLRNTSRRSSGGRLARKARTNQRLGESRWPLMRKSSRYSPRLIPLVKGFDIDPSGTWLAVGDQVSCRPLPEDKSGRALNVPFFRQDGHLSVFSAQPLPDELEPVASFPLSPGESRFGLSVPACAPHVDHHLTPTPLLDSHTDPISTTLFHPTQPWLVTTSGTRRFRKPKPGVRERDWLDSGSSDESNEEDGPKRSGADGPRDEEDGRASEAAGAREGDADGGDEGGRAVSPIHADALSGAASLGIWRLS